MSAYYVIVLVTLLVCVTVYDAAPPTGDRTRESYLADKRGGIPSRFRGNNFRHSLHPLIQQRAAMTPTESRDEDENTQEEDEIGSRGHDVRARDFLGAILGMGMSTQDSTSQSDRIYHSYNYDSGSDGRIYHSNHYHSNYDYGYNRHHQNHHYNDDDDYWYYHYYDDYYDDDDDDDQGDDNDDEHTTVKEIAEGTKASSENVKSGRDDVIKKSLEMRNGGRLINSEEKTKVEGAIEKQMAALKAYKRKTPTVKSSPATRHRLASRDYLGILGMGGSHHSSNNHFDHNQYNKHYYYDTDKDYYDYDYYDYDTDYRKRAVDKEKTPTAAVKRKTPTLAKSDIEGELETLRGSETKIPTVERSRFLQAIKRYMLSSQLDEDAIRK